MLGRRTAVVVGHGGSGTTFGALAAGVPVVIVPLFADQFANAERVAEAGAALVVEPDRRAAGGMGTLDQNTRHVSAPRSRPPSVTRPTPAPRAASAARCARCRRSMNCSRR